ncbi:MAG: sortase [Thermacetogeniaceae bacterium]
MFRNGRLTAAIALLVLMSLGLMAPGYARAFRDAGAPSGKLLVGLRIAGVLDKGADPQHLPGVNSERKDIAATEAACIGDPVFSKGSSDYYRGVSVIVDRAYPYYETGWTLEVANGGELPVRIESIGMVWDGGAELRDFLRLDRIVLRRGELARTLATWGDLEGALRKSEIRPGETLAVDFYFYFEEYGESGRLMPEGASGRVTHLISFRQSIPGWEERGEGAALEPVASGEGPQAYAPPEGSAEEITVPEEPGAVSPPPEVRRGRWPVLPYTGGRMALFICAGMALMALGALLAFYPFGTYLYSWNAQKKLLKELPLRSTPVQETGALGTKGKNDKGEAWGLLEIPAIRLSAAVVAGTSGSDLMKGPGWLRCSAEPGEGNTVIAGHRTMYGGWFYRLRHLRLGDEVLLTHRGEIYRYCVERIWIAEQDDQGAAAPCGYPALTLVTCAPHGDRSKRLIVRARLVGTKPARI